MVGTEIVRGQLVILEKKIEVFLAVADAGSFSRAARRLSLSQSAVSFHVDTLERELGTSLFRRQGRTISLTPEGELLHQETRRLAQEARRVEDVFSEQSASIAQRIRLAGDALTCAFTVPWDLAAFQERYPEVIFTYERLPQDELVEKLVSGELDMGFVGYRIRHRKLATQVCIRDEIILVGAPDRVPDRVMLEELGGLPLLWVTNDRGLELLVSQKLSDAGLPMWKLNIVMEVGPAHLEDLRASGTGAGFPPSADSGSRATLWDTQGGLGTGTETRPTDLPGISQRQASSGGGRPLSGVHATAACAGGGRGRRSVHAMMSA
jgi:DNA-binding transcriptional LysR family regulator